MRTNIGLKYAVFALFILGATLSVYTYSSNHARADGAGSVDPDDPTAVWDCISGQDADGNPVQTCGFGHYQEDCSYQQGVQTCVEDFVIDPPSGAEMFAPIAQDIASGTSFALSASSNGNNISWSYTPTTLATRTFGPKSFSDVLSTATLTLDLYKGVMGSSTLVYSQAISSSTTSGTFPFAADASSTYFAAFSATYPSGSYPPGESPADICTGSGDFCPVPVYLLADFQNALTQGDTLEETTGILGNYIPAEYGITPLTISAAPPPISNVLFLPGTLESRLYTRDLLGEHELWEPGNNLDVGALVMNADGTSKNPIYTRDIVDRLYSNNPALSAIVASTMKDDSLMYAPFQHFMDGLVSTGTLKKWQAYPYDWRYDVSDIVKNGTLVGTATGTPTRIYLQNVVQTLASSSPTGKVTIIAHSNGGLLAKALAVELQKEGKIGLVDKLIMVGTPQLGTPLTIGSMLHGDGDTYALGIVTYSGIFRSVSLTTPGPYDLLPSAAYFSKVLTPVVSFADDALDAPYRAAYGSSITTTSQLLKFLTDIGNTRTAPATTDSLTPAILSNAYIQKAATTHAAIDSWVPPLSLAVTSIVGWGRPTVSQYYYSSQLSGWSCSFSGFLQLRCGGTPTLKHFFADTDDGDNTVVSPSANALGQVLYLDTKELPGSESTTTGHQNLLSVAPIQNQLLDLFEGKSATENYIKATKPTEGSTPLVVVSVHSPVNILATDNNGNQTGIIPIAGFSDIYFIKEDIPGSSVQTVGEDKYISLPINTNYSFSLQGYASGETTVEVDTVDASGNSTTMQTYANIPTTANTTATFSLTRNVTSAPEVDVNGDGKIDLIASSSLSNTSTSTALAQASQQFSILRGHYGLGVLLFLTLEKLRLGKNSTDITAAINNVEKYLAAKTGDNFNEDDSLLLQQSIAKLHL